MLTWWLPGCKTLNCIEDYEVPDVVKFLFYLTVAGKQVSLWFLLTYIFIFI